LERLKNGELLSIAALAREWGISPKTVQRDFAKLMEGDYGVERAEDGKRFCINHQQSISADAATAIAMLESLASDIGGEFYVKAQAILHRLEKQIISPFYTRIDVEDISNKLDMMADLESAISGRRQLAFQYKRWYAPDTIKTYRGVEPYKIIIFDGFWYLLARYKEHTIKFYLKEIRNLEVLHETFTRDPNIIERMNRALNVWFEPDAEPFEVTLLLESDAIVYFERKPIREQYLKKNLDGTAELTLSITHREELFAIMKKWLPQIRIIEPVELQVMFEEMLLSYVSHNVK
jgi:predicted DNA-binding transcriptional regulator YafY